MPGGWQGSRSAPRRGCSVPQHRGWSKLKRSEITGSGRRSRQKWPSSSALATAKLKCTPSEGGALKVSAAASSADGCAAFGWVAAVCGPRSGAAPKFVLTPLWADRAGKPKRGPPRRKEEQPNGGWPLSRALPRRVVRVGAGHPGESLPGPAVGSGGEGGSPPRSLGANSSRNSNKKSFLFLD